MKLEAIGSTVSPASMAPAQTSLRPRLLIAAPSAYPLGGVATWLDGLVAGLRRRGWHAEVALLAGEHHDVDRYLRRHALAAVRRVACASGTAEGRRRALAATIVESGAELVLGVNVGDVEDAVDRVRRAGNRGIRLVTAQHGLQRDFYDHLASRADVVDGVVAANRLGAELARAHAGLPTERVAYAPCGVELDAPHPSTRRGGRVASLRIAWAGRLEEEQKRVGDLPAICARLAESALDFRLSVAGSGPEGERLAAALAPFLRDGRARLLGELGAERMREDLFGDHDLLLVTSSWETGPIVAWEAMSRGLAVVSARFLGSGLEAALRHEETALLFPVGDAAAAAGQLARLLEPALRARLAAAGHAEVQRRYGAEASVDAWEKALLRLASLEPRPPRARARRAERSGRLDHWLGVSLAESLRSALGVRHRQRSPGAEWPHALVAPGPADAFARRAAALDERCKESAEAVG